MQSQQPASMDLLSHLPAEILVEIFSYLCSYLDRRPLICLFLVDRHFHDFLSPHEEAILRAVC